MSSLTSLCGLHRKIWDEDDQIRAKRTHVLQFKCCGADGYADFADKGSWKTNDMTLAGGTAVNVLTPVACCKKLPGGFDDAKKCAGHTTDMAYDTIDEIKDASNYDKV